MDTYYYVSTPLSVTLPQKYKNGQNMTIPVSRCIPNMETNVIMVYAMGNTTKVIYRPACIAPGVDTHYVHDYNVASPMNAHKMTAKQNLSVHLLAVLSAWYEN